jgi:OmpR family response regulator RpaB
MMMMTTDNLDSQGVAELGASVPSRAERILIVDDEASIRRILETRFKMLGYEAITAGDGEEALVLYQKFEPDLVVLDIMMPKLDGYGVTKEIRKRNDVSERITGLELGADDYVIKPFSPKELEARVKSILRRVGQNKPTGGIASVKENNANVLTFGLVKIDFNKRQVFRKNERIRLTGMEFCLLELLASNQGKPFSRGEILQHVWSYPSDQRIDTRVVDVHISRLREKLESDKANPELILTARGIGYMFAKLEGLEEQQRNK